MTNVENFEARLLFLTANSESDSFYTFLGAKLSILNRFELNKVHNDRADFRIIVVQVI